MSNPRCLKRVTRAGTTLAVGLAFVAVPVAAQASAVNLGTVRPFVALGGQTVTNTGPSVLRGDLGVSPGTSLVGFGLPAVVLGAIHANDAVAGQAQADLTTAYDVAAGQPFAPGNDLTDQNLGGKTLTAGAYHYSSSAQLTGTLTLDAEGDPNAQFVFEIGSTLTTAPAAKVVLVNGASPCNVYWQIGSSATLDTTTAFQGNVLALTDITVNNGASVIGRLLARNGQISLINDVLDNSRCTTESSTTPPGDTTTPTQSAPGAVEVAPTATSNGTATLSHAKRNSLASSLRATVRGHLIKSVAFSLDGKRVASRAGSPKQVIVRGAPGTHRLRARVTFRDSTTTKTRKIVYRVALHPRRGPSRFTG